MRRRPRLDSLHRSRSNAIRFIAAEHPALGLDLAEPILERRDPAQVFEDVLLADESHGEPAAGRKHRRRPEELLQQEDALGVVP